MKKIFMAEDEFGIRELIKFACKGQYEFYGYEDGTSFLAALEEQLPDVVLLDLFIPKPDGFEILNIMKATPKYQHIPILIISALDMEYNRIHCLEEGADDFIAKPFSVIELMSRIKAVLRRTSSVAYSYRFESIQLDILHHRVYLDQDEVELTNKEFKLLCYFMENQGRVLSREQLLEKIWGFDYVGETRTVDVHIKTLREKLKLDKHKLKTLYGVGYRFGQ